jgi:hypothetical protein
MKKAFILIFLLAGCASYDSYSYWHKEGLTQEELAKTKYLCLQQAQQPESQKVLVLASMKDAYQGYKETGMITNDTLFSACMNAHGLYWITKRIEPNDI